MRKIAIFAAVLALLLNGCARRDEYARYTTEFIDTFDTVVSATFYAGSQSEADVYSDALHGEMLRLHRLYDRYHAYSGVNNVHTINANAGLSPVAVDTELINLLALAKDMYPQTGGRVDITIGPVTDLWRAAREAGLQNPESAALPDAESLIRAGALMGMDELVIDAAAGTVFLRREGMSLDLGAVAKGYACELAAARLKELGCADFIINGGGNVVAVGAPPGSDGWTVGIRSPDDEQALLTTLTVSDAAVVTSGDYQRGYEVGGEFMHHIIDPDTLMPGTLYRSASVVCADSGLADLLSTALFLTPLDKAERLCDAFDVKAIFVTPDGEEHVIDRR